MKATCTEDEFIALWDKLQSPARVAKALGISERNVHLRRRRLEGKRGVEMKVRVAIPANGVRVTADIQNGIVLVGSDAHYWPGYVSTAHRAFVAACRGLKPDMVVLNGDAFDGAQVSRHPRSGWEQRPTVKQELEAVSDRMAEIAEAAGSAKRHWTWGNHDMRFNGRLAASAHEFEGVIGFDLRDHFPAWIFSTSVMVNDRVQIKHRNYNGIHAAYNATVKTGVTTVNGHLHSLKVTPWTDLTGTRYGVDTGSLADVWGPQFQYTEDGTRNHRAGFAVLTFHDGKLLPPELLEVIDEEEGLVCFRGQVVKV